LITIYKIRNKGLFSHGVINYYESKLCHEPIVKWSRNGKEWTSAKLVQDHLLNCAKLGGIPSDWEIVEFTQQPSKELNDWITAKMLCAILVHDYSK